MAENEKKTVPAPPESVPAPDDAAKRSSRRWRRFLSLYAAVWLLFAALGCTAFYKYLRVYELALPEHVMDSLIESTAPETWLGYVKASIASESGVFDDADALYDEYRNVLLAGKSFSYRRAPESRSDAPVFIVRCGGVDICSVSLTEKPNSALGFGKHLWQVGEIVPHKALGNLRSTAVEITVLTGETVCLNGIALTDAQIAERDIPLSDMPEIENRFSAIPSLTRYRVEGLYGAITVTSGSGEEIAPLPDTGDGVTRYALPISRYSVSIRAPSDVSVMLCGTELTLDDAQSVDRGILRALEEYTGDLAYDTVRWSFENLYSLPDVQAFDDDGTPLSPLIGKDGQMLFFHANNESLQNAVQSNVQYFFNRYIDYSSRAFLGNRDITREAVMDNETEMDDNVRSSMKRYYYLLDCILRTSDLYRYIQESTDAMAWASWTSVSYDELTFTDFSFVSANCFVCTVRYDADFTAHSWLEQKDYKMQNAYELAFVSPNGRGWYAAAMSAVTE